VNKTPSILRTPCTAAGTALVQGILRLRLRFAFAKHNLRSG